MSENPLEAEGDIAADYLEGLLDIIDVDGDSAKSSAYVHDMHLGSGDQSGLRFYTLGKYYDEWKKIDDGWRMVRRVKENPAFVGSMEIFNNA